MKSAYFLQIILLLALLPGLQAEERERTYWVQLVIANRTDAPPTKGAHLVGSKLSKELRSVFNWRKYWEVNRKLLNIKIGETKKTVLSGIHSAEIDLSDPQKRRVNVFINGKCVSRGTQDVSSAMTIIGFDRKSDSAWFVVVRRDKPASD